MASDQDKIRSKLETKVFDRFGKTVTLKSKSLPVYNTRGELESETTVETSITAVPYDITNHRQLFESWGTVSEGEMDMAVPYTVTVNADDGVVVDGVDYLIKEISENLLPDNVVTIVRLAKSHD